MPSITFEKWQGGMDRRRARGVADAATFYTLKNCYVDKGHKITKRVPQHIAPTDSPYPAGAKGLFEGAGELHTFKVAASVSASDVDYVYGVNGLVALNTHYLIHASGDDIAAVWDAQSFAGFMYVITEDASGNIEHHYIDGTWPPRVTDVNAPTDAKQFVVAESKLWAVDGENVRFCATDDARDWTTAADAGFLPTARRSRGNPVAIGIYKGQLAVFSASSLQLWEIDPDPASHTLARVFPNIGCEYPHSLVQVGNDLFFANSAGINSVSNVEITDNVVDIDVGSPIDKWLELPPPVEDVDQVPAVIDRTFYEWVRGAWVPAAGQMWMVVGIFDTDKIGKVSSFSITQIAVFTFSRSSKISAWSYYEFDSDPEYIAAVGLDLFSKSAEYVHRYPIRGGSPQRDVPFSGVAQEIAVEAITNFDPFKKPGQRKHIMGMDAVVRGTWNMAVLYDESDATLETETLEVEGDSRPEGMIGVELEATAVAVKLTHAANEEAGVDLLTFYYDVLGTM